MKKLFIPIIALLSTPFMLAQDLSDAIRYGQDEIQGTARFRALSGAFGALGGDMSAININPASSAVFSKSEATITLAFSDLDNTVNFMNSGTTSSDSDTDITQTGAAFVFKSNNKDSNWKKFSLGFAYDKVANLDNNWVAAGTNTNSIASYFLNYAQGERLDEISAFPGETYSEAYSAIGSFYGYGNQQAFLGYESYILEPNSFVDGNTAYTSNIAPGSFNQQYFYSSRGYNGKFAFNFSTQYKDKLYLGLNLNSHFTRFDKSTFLNEDNNNAGSFVNKVGFENNLYTEGSGFSFQLGLIGKITESLRAGLAYNSPTWYNVREELTQNIRTVRVENGSNVALAINPFIINVFPEYKLTTPGKLTGSLAYIFGKKGLLSVDYSLKDYSNSKFKPTSDLYFAALNNDISNSLDTVSTVRVGGEYKIKQLSLRAGYRFEESPYKQSLFNDDLNGYSFGLGYSFGNFRMDFSYDHSKFAQANQLYAVGLTDQASVETKTNNYTFTMAFAL
ncbi:MAG: transporter [Bacteroidetes bacterium MedPE-SWsnd-G2]|nr:MAG: transporter [Bacteroidetes bacterium MedPE-SWsnd-G2]